MTLSPSPSSSSSAASPATSGTPPTGRAITGTPKWKASSSGMQKPSCSDRQRNALRRAVAVGELLAREAGLDRDRARRELLGELAHRRVVGPVDRRADEHEPRVGRVAAAVELERAHDRVLALVRREAPDEEDRRRACRPGRRRRAARPSSPGSKRIGMTTSGAHLARVVERDARDDVGGGGELRQLLAPERADDGGLRVVVPEPARRRDVVREQQLAVGQLEDGAQLRRVGRVVDEQDVAGRARRASAAARSSSRRAGRSRRRRRARPSPTRRTAPGRRTPASSRRRRVRRR